MLPITTIYALILAVMFLYLCLRVIGFRRRNKIALGDGEDRTLLRRMRTQANFSEYTPITLLLLAIAELNGASGLILHLAGVSLVAGRILHFIGFGREPDILPMRVSGMLLTFASILILIIANGWLLLK